MIVFTFLHRQIQVVLRMSYIRRVYTIKLTIILLLFTLSICLSLSLFFSLNQKNMTYFLCLSSIACVSICVIFFERQQTIKVVTHNPRLSSLTFHWIVTVFLQRDLNQSGGRLEQYCFDCDIVLFFLFFLSFLVTPRSLCLSVMITYK